MKPFKGCSTRKGWIQPKGNFYIVSLGLDLEIPYLKETSLYVHKSVSIPGEWAVTEAISGYSVGRGKTKKEAIDKAFAQLVSVGNDRFQRSVKACVER